MDVLSSVITALRVGAPEASVLSRKAPWGRHYQGVYGVGFHVSTEGSCWLLPDEGEPVMMNAGDVAMFCFDRGHGLADSPATPLFEQLRHGEPRVAVEGEGPRTVWLCGGYQFDRRFTHPLVEALPAVIHLPTRVGRHPELRAVVDLLGRELESDRHGRDAMIPAMLDSLLIYVLRAWFEEATEREGWVAALNDPGIAASLRAVHAEPGVAWTVDALGREAGMSRAGFARSFTAMVGEPPLAYVTRWRMLLAAKRLRESDAPLTTVAREVGYTSEFAFAKAFKRSQGISPGRYRRGEAAEAVPAGATA
jgi:AraC-like DNA-binding protein